MTINKQKYPCGHASHRGRVRISNEDNYDVFPEHGLWVLSDGMGGRDGGEIASDIVVKIVNKSAEDTFTTGF